MNDEVPGYRILQQVGEGGFSLVYRAHQERLDRIVALKVLSVNTVDKATLRRFQRECQITGRLTGHPNVVTVLDTGTSQAGRPYIAMDFFEHGSLRDRLSREGPFPVPDILRIGVKICSALAATHEAEVLHRDVKPQNILVSRYGEPALADFGVARLVDSFESTHTNAFTPHHAAPEVVNGAAPGVASDIYSLGSTLYQLLAGAPAFKGNTDAGIGPLMMRILNEPPPPIQRPDLPPQLFHALHVAMAKDPKDRFPTAIAFAARLQQIQAELRLPVTELAGSGAAPAPPAGAGPDGGPDGSTGPSGGFPGLSVTRDPLEHSAFKQLGDSPAHPAALTTSRVPKLPPASPASVRSPVQPPGDMGHLETAAAGMPVTPAPPPIPPGQPRELTPRTLPPTQDEPPSGRNGVLAGVLAGVLVLAGLGIAGVVLLSGGKKAPPKPGPTTPAAKQLASAPPVDPAVMNAARPFGLKVHDNGPLVTLTWQLGKKGKDLPILIEQAQAGQTERSVPLTVANGTTSSPITGIDPTAGYCFQVGAVVAFATKSGQPAAVAWSAPACIRGAQPQTAQLPQS